MADSNPGRRPPIDFPDRSGLSAGTPASADQAKGLKLGDGSVGIPPSDFGYPEPNVPVFISPGNQRKLDLGSQRN